MMTRVVQISGEMCIEMGDGEQLCYLSFGTNMKEWIGVLISIVEATVIAALAPPIIKAAFDRSTNYASEHHLHTRGNYMERSLGLIKNKNTSKENTENDIVDELSGDTPTPLSIVDHIEFIMSSLDLPQEFPSASDAKNIENELRMINTENHDLMYVLLNSSQDDQDAEEEISEQIVKEAPLPRNIQENDTKDSLVHAMNASSNGKRVSARKKTVIEAELLDNFHTIFSQ